MLEKFYEVGFVLFDNTDLFFLLFNVKGEILFYDHHLFEDHSLTKTAFAAFVVDLVLDFRRVVVPFEGGKTFRLHPLVDNLLLNYIRMSVSVLILFVIKNDLIIYCVCDGNK